MMVIKHTRVTPNIRDAVGARQDILIWNYGVVTGHVVAVHVRAFGVADLVVEFEVPSPVVVPDVGTRQAWMSGE